MLPRRVTTNQRIYFDVHPSHGDLVVTGNTDGAVDVFDLKRAPEEEAALSSATPILRPVMSRGGAHDGDCVNGVAFHPRDMVLATSGGQRHIIQTCSTSTSEEDTDDEEEKVAQNCAVKLWRMTIE